MRRTAKFLVALLVALVLMLCFRALVFTICTVNGPGLLPLLKEGDRVLVNRWSYGLRVGEPFGYGRILGQPVERGELVAFENPQNTDQILICRCKAVPGDTISHQGQVFTVPGRNNCADADYYWMEALAPDNPFDSRQLGFVSERFIIGRAVMVVYSHAPDASPFRGWQSERWLLPL